MKQLLITILIPFFLIACEEVIPIENENESPVQSVENEKEKEIVESGVCTKIPMPATPVAASQLTFILDPNIDPCSVTGFVVGFQDDLKVQKSDNGLFFINNIPAGEHDVIISADTLTLGLSGGKKKGQRFKKLKFLNGVVKEKGLINLPDVGSISGKVTLSGQTDHAGIRVYIPGTSYQATTDTNGTYTISPFVPVGTNNLFFEKSGYHKGQIEEIEVAAGANTVASDIELVLSTGAEGFIILAGGAEYSTKRAVVYTVGATSDAVLMKISESSTFDNTSWIPIITKGAYTFESDGSKTLYVKFANDNGLESSPFNDTLTVDTIAPGSPLSQECCHLLT